MMEKAVTIYSTMHVTWPAHSVIAKRAVQDLFTTIRESYLLV